MAGETEQLVVSLEARVREFERSFQRAQRTADTRFTSIENRAKRSGDALESSMSRAAARANAQLQKVGVGMRPISLGVTLGGFSAAALAAEGAKLADDWTKAQNSLRVAGLEGSALTQVMESLFASAQKNSAPIGALTDLYGKAAQAQNELGASSEDLIKFADGVAVGLKAGGTSASAASGALQQLGQLLGSSRVQAEEFNSINEGARPILMAVAAGLDAAGGSVSKLKQLVNDGAVSNKAFFDAFLKGKPVIDAMAASALPTLEGSATRVTNALTRFVGQSDESLGATARLKAGLNALADNFDQTADMALKVAGVIAAALVGRAIGGMILALGSAGTAIRATIGALVALRGAATLAGVTTALAGLGAAAGPIGALLGAAAAAAIYFATKSDGMAEAAERATGNMQALGLSATSTADEIKRVADELAKLSGAEIKVRVADTSALITSKFRELRDMELPETQRVGRGKVFNEAQDDFRKVTDAFTSGRFTLERYNAETDRIAKEYPVLAKRMTEAQKAAAAFAAALNQRNALDRAVSEQENPTTQRIGRGEAAKGEQDRAAAQTVAIGGVVDAATAEANKTDRQKQIDAQTKALTEAYEKSGEKISDAVRVALSEAATKMVDDKLGKEAAQRSYDASAAGDAFGMIAKFEDFRAQPYWDVNALRTGYGSDTTTAEDGRVSKVTKDTVVTMADAARDLKRRIAEFQTGIRDKIGADRFNGMGEQQQAALTSIAYNYGSLPDRIASVIKANGTTDEIANAIRALGSDNGGVNMKRRNAEADAFAGGATYQAKQADTAADFDTNLNRDGTRRVEDINAETAALQRQAQAQGMLGTAVDQFDAKAERERIIREEMRKLADADIAATPERIAQINALADAQVAAAQRRADAERQVQAAQDNAQTKAQFVEIEKDAVKGIVSDLRNGKSAAEAFASALDKIADKLINMAIDSMFAANPAGGAGGGGGFGILNVIGSVLGFKDGGLIDARKMPAFATGGYVSGPGGPRSDDIMARLSNGEFVVNAQATKQHRPMLDAINSGRVPAFADGGMVGGAGGMGMLKAGSGGGSATNVRMGDINLTMPSSSGDRQKDASFADTTAKMVRSAMREEIASFVQNERRAGGMLADDTA